MQTQEIELEIHEARCACAEAQSAREGGLADAMLAVRLSRSLTRLCAIAEELLEERESFMGRLRRVSSMTSEMPHTPRLQPPAGERSADAPTP